MLKKKTVNILEKLIRIPSFSGDAKACQKIVAFSVKTLKNHTVNPDVLMVNNRKAILWGEKDLSKSKWLINSHLDVVQGNPDQFIPIIKHGRIFGRGSADTKGAVSVLISQAKCWEKIALEKSVTFMLVEDEEIGGETTKLIIGKMNHLQGAVFLERTNEKIIVKAKGIMQIRIRMEGISSHGSRPWTGINAIEKLNKVLTIFLKLHPTPKRETKKTTFNFSIISSGNTINQIPNEAILWCDVRFNPNDNPKNIEQDFKKIFGKKNVLVIKCESPIDCPINSVLFKTFSHAVRENNIKEIKGFDHVSSDARHAHFKNIPAVVFGPIGENIHSNGEWVSVSSIDNISHVLDSWIKSL